MKSKLELNRVGDDSSKYGGGREGKEKGIHKKVIIMGYFFGSVFKTAFQCKRCRFDPLLWS